MGDGVSFPFPLPLAGLLGRKKKDSKIRREITSATPGRLSLKPSSRRFWIIASLSRLRSDLKVHPPRSLHLSGVECRLTEDLFESFVGLRHFIQWLRWKI